MREGDGVKDGRRWIGEDEGEYFSGVGGWQGERKTTSLASEEKDLPHASPETGRLGAHWHPRKDDAPGPGWPVCNANAA